VNRVTVHAKLIVSLLCGAVLIGFSGWTVLADKKDIPRLTEMATNDTIPIFRLAASRTLVAAYLFTGKTLQELKPIAQKTEQERGFKELSQAIREAEQGKVTDACFTLPEIKSTTVDGENLSGKTKEELEFQAQFGKTDNVRKTAAQILLKNLLEPVTKRQPQWYSYRVKEEEHFDGIKVQLYLWTVAVISVPMQEVNLPPLSQVFYAEFLITLQPSFVEPKLKCKK
jgi:hypothetical protein